jgi:hypothetical protein
MTHVSMWPGTSHVVSASAPPMIAEKTVVPMKADVKATRASHSAGRHTFDSSIVIAAAAAVAGGGDRDSHGSAITN